MSTSEITTSIDALNPRQRAFVVEYMKDKNATKAYERAGYELRGAAAGGAASRLLGQSNIAREVARLEAQELQRIQAKHGVSLERTLKEIAKGAFYDPRKMFTEDGFFKGIKDLDDVEAAAIEGFDIEENYVGKGDERIATGRTIKVKLAKRAASLDMLMKHLNGYKAHEQGKGEGAVNALAELLGGMRRSAIPIVSQVDPDQGEG